MYKILATLVLSMSAAACNQMSVNLAGNRADKFPMIGWSPIGQDPALQLKVTSIDSNNIGRFDTLAYINKGPRTAEYSCAIVGRSGAQPDTGIVKIDAKDGMMYFIRPVRKTHTKSWVAQEPLLIATTVTRDADGRLLGKVEPVYFDIPRSRTDITGCEAEVYACKGYLYSLNGGYRYLCLEEPMSVLSQLLFRDKQQWRSMF